MHRSRPLAEFLRRLIAAGSAALVLTLAVFAASPVLHDRLHTATDTTHDDSCAVGLFAHGVSLPFDAIAAPLPPATLAAPAPAFPRDIFVSPPRYLRQPERGPPARLLS